VRRSRSKAELVAQVGIVVEEIDETVFWIELMAATEIFKKARLKDLLTDANEILAISAASQRTARSSMSR